MIVDSHCHLDLIAERNEWTVDELIKNARDAGVERLLSIGIDQENSEKVVSLSEAYPNVYATAGVHPVSANSQVVDRAWLEEWGGKDSVIALGETGLDYYHDPLDKAKQWQSFSTHLELAEQLDKPVIVHTRNAKADTLSLIQEHKNTKGVLHCFTEDWDMAEQALALGYYISISGIVTFKKAEQIRDVVKRVPLDRLLIETDSPYLAPVPFRGKTNQPAYVQYVASTCADLKQIPLKALHTATTDNFNTLFGVS